MQKRRDKAAGAPAIGLARLATTAESRLIRSELAGIFGATLRLRKSPAVKGFGIVVEGPGGISGSPSGPRPRFKLGRARVPAGDPSAERCRNALASAVEALGPQDGRDFLNGHHRGLNGPPLELAAASSTGLRVVEAAIRIEARRRAGKA